MNRPCDVIQPGETCQFGSESWGVAVGTEAQATYSYNPVNNANSEVTIHWNNPYIGGNDFDVWCKSADFSRGGISGNRNVVDVRVWNK